MTTAIEVVTGAIAFYRGMLCSSLSFRSYAVLPVPTLVSGNLLLATLIGRGEVVDPEQGYQIWPPHLVALYETQAGDFKELRTIAPSDLSQRDRSDRPLGSGVSPAAKQEPAYVETQALFVTSCGKALAAYADGTSNNALQMTLWQQFQAATESPLHPYAQALLFRQQLRAALS